MSRENSSKNSSSSEGKKERVLIMSDESRSEKLPSSSSVLLPETTENDEKILNDKENTEISEVNGERKDQDQSGVVAAINTTLEEPLEGQSVTAVETTATAADAPESSNPIESNSSSSGSSSWQEKRQLFVDCQDLKYGSTAFMIAISQRLDLDQPQDNVTEAFRALKANPQIRDKVRFLFEKFLSFELTVMNWVFVH